MLLSGQNVRKYYQRRLPSNPSKDYYFIIRDTSPDESILMEYAFLDSTKDDVNQIKNNYEGLAEAVVKSLAEYIGVKYIPPVSSNATYYIVKSGDTLYSIARKFNISVDKLKELNGLKSNLISVGQNLLVSELNASNINPNNNNNNTYYTVVKGDSLWSIAKKFNTTVDNLKKLNNLNSNLLQIGQKLIVNENASSNSETNLIKYTVVKGDTLYSISRKFNTTVSEISSINNLKTNILQIGQELLVPNNKK